MRSAEAPPVQLFDGSATDLSKQVGLKAVAAQLAEQGSIGLSEAVELFYVKRSSFHDVITNRFYPDGIPGSVGSCETFQATQIKCFLYKMLPVVAVPYREPGQSGLKPMLLVPDVPTLSDAELQAALKPVLELKWLQAQSTSAAAGDTLTAQQYALLQRSMPSEMSALTDALILKYGGDAAIRALGIGSYRAATAAQRLDLLVNTTLPAAQREAHAAATMLLAKRAGLSDDSITMALQVATTRQLRRLVLSEGLLRDRRMATHKSLLEQAPDLLEVLISCARAGSNAVYKEHGETPVDQIAGLSTSIEGS